MTQSAPVPRSRWSIVVAAVLLAIAVASTSALLWLDDEVVDQQAFVDSAVEALLQPEARDQLAVVITDKLVENLPVLATVRGPLEATLSQLLASPQLRGLTVDIALDVHARMMAGETGPVVVDLSEYREAILAPIEALSPTLAQLVPDSLFQAVEILDDGIVPDLSWHDRWGTPITIAWAVASIGLIVLLLAWSESRVAGIVLIGLALVAAGIGTAVLAPLSADTLVARYVTDPNLQPIGRVVYDALTRTLIVRSLVVGAAGFIVAGLGFYAWNRDEA